MDRRERWRGRSLGGSHSCQINQTTHADSVRGRAKWQGGEREKGNVRKVEPYSR